MLQKTLHLVLIAALSSGLLAANGSLLRSVQASDFDSNAREIGLPSCIDETMRASIRALGITSEYDKTHFPKFFTANDKKALLDRFKADGRPILVVTDGYSGLKNGVVTVMKVLKEQVEKLTDGKVSVRYVTPDQFHPQMTLKSMQNIMLSRMSKKEFSQILRETQPQAVHVMVEGALGRQARKYLLEDGIPFTTAYHTTFPEIARDEAVKRYHLPRPIPEALRKVVNANLRKFHEPSEGILVPTNSMAENLIANGYKPEQLRYWSHGVDENLFHPSKADPKLFEGLPRPISLFVGRMSAEKNIEDFLKMQIPGTKVVVGDGPMLKTLRQKYPEVTFVGFREYKDLPAYYASSDIFVFPALSETFGLVQLEANASGIPVAAYKVQGPVDVITSPKAGVLADYKTGAGDRNVRELEEAWDQARKITRQEARSFAEEHTWEQSTLEFLWFLSRLPQK